MAFDPDVGGAGFLCVLLGWAFQLGHEQSAGCLVVDHGGVHVARVDRVDTDVLGSELGCEGRADSVIPVEEARPFVKELRAVSGAPTVYAELPGAQHAFELFGSPRARHSARAVERFLNLVWTARPDSGCDPGPHAS